MCRKLGLYGEEITVTDSVKFRANNSLKNNYNKTVVENELSRIDKKISEYMEALETEDSKESSEVRPAAEKLQAALEELRQRKVIYEEFHERVTEEGEISTVDPDARIMRSGGDGRRLDVGYNVHTIVDSKYHMIVDFELTNNSSDAGNLYKITGRAKEVVEAEQLVNLADKGYYDSKDIAEYEENGVYAY